MFRQNCEYNHTISSDVIVFSNVLPRHALTPRKTRQFLMSLTDRGTALIPHMLLSASRTNLIGGQIKSGDNSLIQDILPLKKT